MKKAVVIGGTGLVGSELIKQLIDNKEYSEIVSLVRKASGVTHPKLNEQRIDFDKPENWSDLVTGDVLFSTLGTTLAQAKSKDAQYKVDFSYQYDVAKLAAQNGVTNYVLISSSGANAKSGAFYLSMKGQLEDAVKTLPFKVISIIRPGLLAGNRTQKRLGEKVGFIVLNAINKLGIFKQYRPIQASIVASAMIRAAEKEQSASYTLEEVFILAQE